MDKKNKNQDSDKVEDKLPTKETKPIIVHDKKYWDKRLREGIEATQRLTEQDLLKP